jgi:hypothetical protein
MSDRLGQLLRDVDSAALPAAPAPAPDLALRVRRLRNRRRRAVRLATGVTALCLVAVVIAAAALRERPLAPLTPLTPPVALLPAPAPTNKPTLASLRLDADLHEQTAARLAGSAPRAVQRLASTSAKTGPDVQRERDRAALLLVYEADQRAKQHRPADAIAAYRRAVELFPQTRWAQVARQRLKEIES